jgi:uncharacterized membrane protein YphA (DoxX/SURF4 family)
MNYGRHNWSHIFLRFGLGIVFLWIGIDMFRHPDAWIGYLPATLPFGLSRSLMLTLTSLLDSAIGLCFMLNFLPKWVAAVAALHLIGIIAYNGIDAVIIRDVGLLGASLALVMWPSHYRHY